MAITAGEQSSGGEVRDNDGRLIVVGPGGVSIGGGGAGADPLSDGTPGGALPTKTLWIAGANGAVLQGLQADATGRLRTVVEGTPAVSVSNFPATQPVTGTFFQATQPVSLATNTPDVTDRAARLLGHVTVDTAPTTAVTGPLTDTQLRASAVPTSLAALPALTAGAAVIGKVDQGTAGASAWKVDGSAVTQPVSLAALPTVTEKQDQPAATATTWTSATALNTAVTVNTTGYGTANVSIQVPSTVTAGVITLEVSDDAGTTYYQAGAVRVDNGQQENVVTLPASPGIALNRMYSVSVDAMTQIRARLSTVIVGAGNVLVRVGTVAGGIEPFVAQRPRKVATYRAVVRVAASPFAMSNVFGAAGRKQFATIHHAAAAVRTVRLRRAQVKLSSTTAGAFITFELRRITTAPATPAPAITPSRADTGDAAAEATVMALPGTAGTEEAQPYSTESFNLGVTAAGSQLAPPPPLETIDLLDATAYDDEAKAPSIRAGVLEGWAVTCDVNAATTINVASVELEFTEEPA